MSITVQSKLLTLGVIIPVFNSGRDAIHSIRSVVEQTYDMINEIIVVDDGSDDDSARFLREACEGLSIRVTIISIPNGGAANARNHGMQNCSCDLYAFLDSDDTWISNKLELQLPAFNDPAVGLVGCLTTMDKGKAIRRGVGGLRKVIGIRQQLLKNYFQTSTVIVRRNVVESVGPFPNNQRYAEEGDFFNRIAARYECVLLPEVLVNYGGGKQGFGESGLSSNLVAMEKGELHNILRAYLRRDCSFAFFGAATAYSLIKFVRRLIVTYLRRLYQNVKLFQNHYT
jgi:glycosyltransferase involved in cell wall biosynthesis